MKVLPIFGSNLV